jgi:hypothetical protein
MGQRLQPYKTNSNKRLETITTEQTKPVKADPKQPGVLDEWENPIKKTIKEIGNTVSLELKWRIAKIRFITKTVEIIKVRIY